MHLCNFFAIVERQFNTKVKIVRSDNGTKFTCMHSYFHKHGILHETLVRELPNKMDELNISIGISLM